MWNVEKWKYGIRRHLKILKNSECKADEVQSAPESLTKAHSRVFLPLWRMCWQSGLLRCVTHLSILDWGPMPTDCGNTGSCCVPHPASSRTPASTAKNSSPHPACLHPTSLNSSFSLKPPDDTQLLLISLLCPLWDYNDNLCSSCVLHLVWDE